MQGEKGGFPASLSLYKEDKSLWDFLAVVLAAAEKYITSIQEGRGMFF